MKLSATKNKQHMPEVFSRSRRLKLVHRSHTGRRLHRGHTSYPLLAALLLMVGVLLTMMTYQAAAEDVVVNAVVNGDPPTIAAVILSPVNDQRFTDPSVPVSGTCQPLFFVKIFRNNIFAGTSECSENGTFAVTIELFPGRNDLVARSFNVGESEGPPSNTVSVYYDAPYSPDAEPYYLTSEYFFRAAFTGQRIVWDFDIVGGCDPYSVMVAWGDGYSDTIKDVKDTRFRVEHKYRSPKEQREHFIVTVTVHDCNGKRTALQLVAIMNDPMIIGANFAEPASPSPLGSNLGLLWAAFAVVTLMGICFWLGERRGESVTESYYHRHPA